MTADKLVSVIVPVYNSEKHIAAALSSIINQDYGSLEIIIVNDASTDSSREIAQDVLSHSARPHRIIDHPRNLGVSAARNTGLDAAKGDYVWFCDSDDLPDEHFVSMLCRKAHDNNLDAVFCGLKHYYEDKGAFMDEVVNIPELQSPEQYLEAWADGKVSFWSVWNFIFRKDFIMKNNLRFTEGCMYGEDTEFVMKVIMLASNTSSVRDILYTYVHYSTQTISKNREPAMFSSLTAARFRTWRFMLKHTSIRKVKDYILSYCIPDMIVERLTVCVKAGDKKAYTKFTRTLKHGKVRRLLLSSVRYIMRRPELFFKSLALIYAPNLYYSLRK